MMTGSQVTVDGGPALRFERRLDHSVERVWRAVTEPAELARWFVSEVPWKPAAGEVFEAGGDAGRITAFEPPRLIAWTWGAERYSFELTADGDGCVLVFTHVFNPQLGPSWQHAAGWETYFSRLDAHLAGGFQTEEEAHRGIAGLIKRYREAFGADRGRAQRMFPMLSALDMQASIAFYRDLLGGTEAYRFPQDDPVFVTLQLGETEIGIGGVSDAPLHGQAQRPAAGHRVELCVYVGDVDEAVDAARAARAPVLLEPTDQSWGERVAYISDPDGNLVMLTAANTRGTSLDGGAEAAVGS